LGKSILRKIVSWSEEEGAREAEAFFSMTEYIDIVFEKKSIILSERKRSSGYGIRLVTDKQDGRSVGLAYSNDSSAGALRSAIERALETANSKASDPSFIHLQQPNSMKPGRIEFDPQILERDPTELLSFAQSLIDTADSSKRIRTVSGSLLLSKSVTAIANSLGVYGSYRMSNFDVGVFASSKDGESVGVGWDGYSACTIDQAAALESARKAGELAVFQLHPKRVKSARLPLVICPEGFAQILSSTLIPEVNAENVYNGDSLLAGKIGESIGSETLTVCDDGTLHSGVGSKPFDDEGCPTRKTKIIVKGVLKSFLHNSYTSNREQLENTGNSFRPGGRHGMMRYSTEPSISPTNLLVKTGSRSQDELIHQIDEGIIVKGFIGTHTANPRTGDFSLVLYCASKIERGELAYPIGEAVVGGNIQDLLRNISEIGSDSKQISIGPRVGIISPSLIAEDLAISG